MRRPESTLLTGKLTGAALLNLGGQGRAGVVEQGALPGQAGVTNTRDANGIAAVGGAGERNLITGATTNYQHYRVTTDVRVQYRWNNNITLFANVDNIQNLPFGGFASRRSYRAGVRFNY